MEARRLKEDKERQEKYLRDIEDLPPLEPLEDLVEDGQVPGTSGYPSTITWTIVRTPSWEREASDEWDKLGWEKTVESIASRPEFGEDHPGKGKGGKGAGRWVKAGEVVKFGEVMNRKEHELLDARCAVVRAIAEGLELAKTGDVEPEEREFFEKIEKGFEQVEEERAAVNKPKVWGRAGMKGPTREEEERERKDDRGRRKERKRDSKEGRHRERRDSRDKGERKYRERKDSKEGRRRKERRRSSSRSDN